MHILIVQVRWETELNHVRGTILKTCSVDERDRARQHDGVGRRQRSIDIDTMGARA